MMNVLYIASYDGLYGANQSLLQLITELQIKGVSPLVLLPQLEDKSNSLHEKLRQKNIPYIVSFFYPSKGDCKWKDFIRIVLNLRLYLIVIWKLRSYKIDIVHSNTSIMDIGKIISCFKRAKHVWHLREFGDLDYRLFHPLGDFGQKMMYQGTDAFIAISKRIYNHFAPYVNPERIYLIYNGINSKAFIPSNHTNALLNFCMVGYINPIKNQFLAVQAVEILKRRNVNDFHLTFIGEGTKDYMELINTYISDHKIEPFISFLGYCSDIPGKLSHMDVGLMLSVNEAFGRVTIEYEMSNMVVIASNTGANTEIIEDGKTGLLLESMNADKLADKMQYLIQNRNEVIRLSLNGKVDALKRFQSTRNSDSIYELYKSLF